MDMENGNNRKCRCFFLLRFEDGWILVPAPMAYFHPLCCGFNPYHLVCVAWWGQNIFLEVNAGLGHMAFGALSQAGRDAIVLFLAGRVVSFVVIFSMIFEVLGGRWGLSGSFRGRKHNLREIVLSFFYHRSSQGENEG